MGCGASRSAYSAAPILNPTRVEKEPDDASFSPVYLNQLNAPLHDAFCQDVEGVLSDICLLNNALFDALTDARAAAAAATSTCPLAVEIRAGDVHSSDQLLLEILNADGGGRPTPEQVQELSDRPGVAESDRSLAAAVQALMQTLQQMQLPSVGAAPPIRLRLRDERSDRPELLVLGAPSWHPAAQEAARVNTALAQLHRAAPGMRVRVTLVPSPAPGARTFGWRLVRPAAVQADGRSSAQPASPLDVAWAWNAACICSAAAALAHQAAVVAACTAKLPLAELFVAMGGRRLVLEEPPTITPPIAPTASLCTPNGRALAAAIAAQAAATAAAAAKAAAANGGSGGGGALGGDGTGEGGDGGGGSAPPWGRGRDEGDSQGAAEGGAPAAPGSPVGGLASPGGPQSDGSRLPPLPGILASQASVLSQISGDGGEVSPTREGEGSPTRGGGVSPTRMRAHSNGNIGPAAAAAARALAAGQAASPPVAYGGRAGRSILGDRRTAGARSVAGPRGSPMQHHPYAGMSVVIPGHRLGSVVGSPAGRTPYGAGGGGGVGRVSGPGNGGLREDPAGGDEALPRLRRALVGANACVFRLTKCAMVAGRRGGGGGAAGGGGGGGGAAGNALRRGKTTTPGAQQGGGGGGGGGGAGPGDAGGGIYVGGSGCSASGLSGASDISLAFALRVVLESAVQEARRHAGASAAAGALGGGSRNGGRDLGELLVLQPRVVVGYGTEASCTPSGEGSEAWGWSWEWGIEITVPGVSFPECLPPAARSVFDAVNTAIDIARTTSDQLPLLQQELGALAQEAEGVFSDASQLLDGAAVDLPSAARLRAALGRNANTVAAGPVLLGQLQAAVMRVVEELRRGGEAMVGVAQQLERQGASGVGSEGGGGLAGGASRRQLLVNLMQGKSVGEDS